MDTFTAITQFDNSFKVAGNFGNERSACGIFALICAGEFMKDGSNTKERHEENIKKAVQTYIALRENRRLDQFQTFDDIVKLVGISPSKIEATTCELVREQIIGYDSFLPLDLTKFCTIFLKDYTYFVVTFDGEIYSVRDSHQSEQYNFLDRELLKAYMNGRYRMETDTVIDGVAIPEYNNIELVKITEKIDLNRLL